MEINRVSSGFVDLERTIASLMVETALTAQKTLPLLLLMIGSLLKDIDLSDVLGAEKRFPFGDLSRVVGPAAENMDAGESEDDDDDEDNENDGDGDDSDDDDDDEDSSGEDGSDDNGDPDDDSDANGNGGSDDDDDDNDDDDSDEDDDESDEDDDDDDDNQPPFKKKK